MRAALPFLLAATIAGPVHPQRWANAESSAAGAAAPREDWRPRRDRDRALAEHASTALLASPHRPGLAARLARELGAKARERLLTLLRAQAARPSAGYAEHAALGEALLAFGAAEEAARAFRSALALRPSAPAAAALGRALAGAGDRLGACAAFERAATLERAVDRKRAHLARAADLAAELGDADRELRLLTAAVSDARPTPGEARALALALRRAGRPADAVATLERCSAAPNDACARDARVWQELADAREDLGDLPAALAAAQRAHARAPADVALGARVVALAERLGDDARALAVLEQLERDAPWDVERAIARIELLARRGRTEEAGRAFDAALRRFARRATALARLADLAALLSDGERTFAAWDAVLTLDPKSERAIESVGELHMQRGRRELARRTWEKLLVAVEPPARAHARLAETLSDHGLAEEARKHIELAMRAAPDDPAIERVRANVLERRRDRHGAIAAWRRVLELSPGADGEGRRKEARARITELAAEEGRGRLELEARALRDRVRSTPSDREALLALVDIERRLGHPERSIELLREAALRAPDATELVMPLVRLLRQSRQLAEAREQLERLALTSPAAAPRARLELADLELLRHDVARALEHAAQAEAATDELDLRLRAAGLRERCGDHAGAAASYATLIARDGSGRAAAGAARLAVAAGRPAEALALLRRALLAATEPDTRADLLAAALPLAEALGELGVLAAETATRVDPRPTPERSTWLALLERTRNAGDAANPRAWPDQGRRALRPLVAAMTDPTAPADPRAIDWVGHLGRVEVAPALLAALPTAGPPSLGPSAVGSPGAAAGPAAARSVERGRIEVAVATALGRLRAPAGLPPLRALTASPDASARAAAIWALGRNPAASAEDRALIERAFDDRWPEIAAAAALALGERDDDRTRAVLVGLAADGRRPALVREAALVAFAATERGTWPAPPVLALLASPEPRLARAAATALAAAADPSVLPALVTRALVEPTPTARHSRFALEHFGARLPRPPKSTRDDGPELGIGLGSADTTGFDVRRALDATATAFERDRPFDGASGATTPMRWGEHGAALATGLAMAVTDASSARRARAWLTLADARTAFAPGVAAALEDAAASRFDLVAAGARDPEPFVRLATLRTMAKLRPERVTAEAIAELLPHHPPERTDAAGTVATEQTLVEITRRALAAGLAPNALVAALRRPAAHAEPAVRRLAIALARVAGPAARDLLAAADHDPSALVRGEARRARSLAKAREY